MQMKTEADLRTWLKAGGIDFVRREPGLGSDAGLPDLSVLVDGVALELELKIWDVVTRGKNAGLFRAKMRREQVRWHYQAAINGRNSGILFGCNGGDGYYYVHSGLAPRRVNGFVNYRDVSFYHRNEAALFRSDIASRQLGIVRRKGLPAE